MIQNYFITSLRNLRRNWNFTAINVTGLTLGLACCLLIFFTVRYELSFDTHHRNADSVYRLLRYNQKLGEKGYSTGALLPSLAALKNDYPELKDQVTCTYAIRETLVTVGEGPGRKKYLDPIYSVSFVGPEYFNLLDYKWLRGSAATALKNPGAVVLTESQAKKYFGETDPIGKSIRVDNRMNFAVTGVVADP